MEQEQQPQNANLFELSIDQTSRIHLTEAAKWARFLAIVGFIFLGLFALIMIFAGTYISTMFSRYRSVDNGFNSYSSGMTIGIIIYYLCIFALVFFAYLFLYRFAANMRSALASNDQNTLNRSFQNLKILYRYWGILTIIGLSLFIIFFLFAIIIGGSAMM